MTEHAEILEAAQQPQTFPRCPKEFRPGHICDATCDYEQVPIPETATATLRYLNESAIKQHALTCAARCRPKFTRVGQDFIDEVKADVEAFIRDLRNAANREVAPHQMIEPNEDFLTGALIEKLKPILNKTVARIIQSKVQRQTTGKTLSATR